MKWIKVLKNNLAKQWRLSDPLLKIFIIVLFLVLLPLAFLIINRITVDFSNNKTEYEHMVMIDRVVNGKPLYAPISTEYVPITYTPLYWWVSGLLCKVFGMSMLWPRLLSLFSSMIFAWLIAAFVWTRTEHNLFLSVASSVLIMATTSFVLLTVVNINALHLALTLAGFYLLSRKLSVPRIIIAAVALSLSALTKQTGLAYVIAGTVLVFLKSVRKGVLFGLVSVLLLAVVLGWLNTSSDGVFFRVVVTENRGPPWVLNRLWDEVIQHYVLGVFGIMLLFALVPFLRCEVRKWWSIALSAEYVMCGAGLAVACIAWPKIGSGIVHGIVGSTGLVICGCIGLHQLFKIMPLPFNSRFLACVILLQLAIILVPTIKDYRFSLIDDDDRQKYEQIAQIFQSGQTTLYSGYSYLPRVFGQPSAGHQGNERCRWKNGRFDFSNKPSFLSEPFRRQEFDYVVMSVFNSQADPTVRAILENYRVIGRLPQHPRGPTHGSMRQQMLVLKANRFFPRSIEKPNLH